MKRNQRTELIVLQSEKNGENHKLVSMFTEKFGLVRAIAFGASGSKSPMRAATSPFCLSDGELYHDPVKDLWRITHLNGKNLYDGIRGNLKKFYIVSFLAEVVLKTYGGGDDRRSGLLLGPDSQFKRKRGVWIKFVGGCAGNGSTKKRSDMATDRAGNRQAFQL